MARAPYQLVVLVLAVSCTLLSVLFGALKLRAAVLLCGPYPPSMKELREFLTAGHGTFVPPPTPPGLPVVTSTADQQERGGGRPVRPMEAVPESGEIAE